MSENEISPKFSVLKSKATPTFSLRTGGGEWAMVYLDEVHNLFLANTSFGVFSHNWHPAKHETLRDFILGLGGDSHYITKKIAIKNDYFYAKETGEAIKAEIKKRLKLNLISSEEAREALVELIEVVDICFNHDSSLPMQAILMERGAILKILDEYESIPFITGPDPQTKAFMTVIWPCIIDYLKREKANDGPDNTPKESEACPA